MSERLNPLLKKASSLQRMKVISKQVSIKTPSNHKTHLSKRVNYMKIMTFQTLMIPRIQDCLFHQHLDIQMLLKSHRWTSKRKSRQGITAMEKICTEMSNKMKEPPSKIRKVSYKIISFLIFKNRLIRVLQLKEVKEQKRRQNQKCKFIPLRPIS